MREMGVVGAKLPREDRSRSMGFSVDRGAYDKKDYVVQIKVRNAKLRRAIKATGMTMRRFAEFSGINVDAVYKYLALTKSPIRADGSLSPSAKRLEEALHLPIEELFPERHLRTPLKTNNAEIEMGFSDVAAICGRNVLEIEDQRDLEADVDVRMTAERLLEAVTPRERLVLEKRFGLNGSGELTLEQVAEEMDITRERVRQIEIKGLRRMRIRRKKEVGAALEA